MIEGLVIGCLIHSWFIDRFIWFVSQPPSWFIGWFMRWNQHLPHIYSPLKWSRMWWVWNPGELCSRLTVGMGEVPGMGWSDSGDWPEMYRCTAGYNSCKWSHELQYWYSKYTLVINCRNSTERVQPELNNKHAHNYHYDSNQCLCSSCLTTAHMLPIIGSAYVGQIYPSMVHISDWLFYLNHMGQLVCWRQHGQGCCNCWQNETARESASSLLIANHRINSIMTGDK